MAINRDRKPVPLLLFFALSKNTEDMWTRLMEEKETEVVYGEIQSQSDQLGFGQEYDDKDSL